MAKHDNRLCVDGGGMEKEKVKSPRAAKTRECVALALGVAKIRDDGCELSHIDGNVCCLGEVYFPTSSKQIVRDHDRKVRAEEFEAFIGLLSGGIAQGWSLKKFLETYKKCKDRADRTIFEPAVQKEGE